MSKLLILSIFSFFIILINSQPNDYLHCSGNGYYVNYTDYCFCNQGYATLDLNYPCNYPQTKQLTIFLIQFFLGYLGVGNFLLGKYAEGILELILFCSWLFLFFGSIELVKYRNRKYKFKEQDNIRDFKCFHIHWGMIFAIILWWLITLGLIAGNYYNDKNNIPLQPF